MNWKLEGGWKQFQGRMKSQWRKFMAVRLDAAVDKRVGGAGREQSAELCVLKEQNPSRRTVLRGALAVGCGLLVPAALTGCDSKKGESPTGAAPASPPDTGAAPSAPAASVKVSQASVQYQTQPKGDQKCSECLHFVAESNTCKLVEGQISPDGWCTLWVRKA